PKALQAQPAILNSRLHALRGKTRLDDNLVVRGLFDVTQSDTDALFIRKLLNCLLKPFGVEFRRHNSRSQRRALVKRSRAAHSKAGEIVHAEISRYCSQPFGEGTGGSGRIKSLSLHNAQESIAAQITSGLRVPQ